MEILIKAAQLLLSLSILVIVHEFGHFIAARIFKTRVEKFYLFFNPWFSLFKFRRGETEYGLGWLPLGGYVKISGMIDESMDKEQMKQEPQAWEFRSKPAWQRLIIMLGGVTVNVLLAILIYIVMLAAWGEEYLSTSQVNTYGITVDSMGRQMGLLPGDKIIAIDGKVVEDFSKIPGRLILDEAKVIRVNRDGIETDVFIPEGFLRRLLKHRSADFIGVRTPFTVGKLANEGPAEKAGLKTGDRLIGVAGVSTPFFDQFREEVRKYSGKQATISLIRTGDTLAIPVNVSEQGLIGVYNQPLSYYFQFSHQGYPVLAAIPAGVIKAYRGIGNYLKQLRLLFSPELKAYESVGGFITIGNIFPSAWNWPAFWELTAFLSIMLAILNVLPIPALDGGHVLFLLYEIVTRRKPSDKFLEYAQIVGMILLFALLIFANGNDIIRLFRN
ncbi:MAG TPA: RIP metalloprotease RseP [Bacteroidales bacterium]|nr:RIP metalloprotease RseP [Bacteroidales bacterium]HSA43911.1 RIP metalloprotease RseP [Bacteroidales bacterium]